MKITAFDAKKGKDVCAGIYTAKDKTFRKTVNTEHYMVKEKGYGIQDTVVAQLHNVGCEKIHLDTGAQTLEYPFSLLEQKTSKDYGHGTQVFVTIKEAIIIKKPIAQPNWLRKG